MKIQLNMMGSEIVKPDFAMLRAGIAAAQATTPTAAASEVAHAHRDPTEALVLLFGDRVTGSPEAAALHGSFHPVSFRDDDRNQDQK